MYQENIALFLLLEPGSLFIMINMFNVDKNVDICSREIKGLIFINIKALEILKIANNVFYFNWYKP